jgi:hypothetical protein
MVTDTSEATKEVYLKLPSGELFVSSPSTLINFSPEFLAPRSWQQDNPLCGWLVENDSFVGTFFLTWYILHNGI